MSCITLLTFNVYLILILVDLSQILLILTEIEDSYKNMELILLDGYGQFVWPAFIFTFVIYFLFYLKTKTELKKQENRLLIELKQNPLQKIELVKKKEFSRKILPASITN